MFRFLRYVSVTLPTFALDMSILYTLVNFFNVEYVHAAGTSYFIATTVNYLLSRKFVFAGTRRAPWTGYFYFILISIAGLIIVTSFMWLFVYLFGVFYIGGRIMSGIMEGMWNYVMNLNFNFRVANVKFASNRRAATGTCPR